MLARDLVRRLEAPLVHVYFHDTDLLDRRRALALRLGLLALARRRGAAPLDALEELAGEEIPFSDASEPRTR
jgi:hypothetical protein